MGQLNTAAVDPSGARQTQEPIRWWQRFYVRLAALFLVLLFGLGFVLALLSAGAAEELMIAADQELHRDLALELAPRFEPHLQAGVDEEAINSIIAGLTQINRRIDVYLLESDGEIKGWFMDGGAPPVLSHVSLGPIMRIMSGEPPPIFGDDPAYEDVSKTFAVSPITVMGKQGCYLYIILQGEDYDHVLAMLRMGLLKRLVLRVAFFAFVLTALVGLFLFWWVSRRLSMLRSTVTDFEQGQLSRRFDVHSTDEIGRLGSTFNSMADRIEGQVAELRNTDRLRRELVANVSHDLRSPLASIQGYLETLQLKEDSLDPEKRRGYLNVALGQTKRLSSLVSQLFELSKLDARQIEPDFESFPIAELVQDVVMQYEPEAEKKGVRLVAVLPETSLPLVRADIGLMERVLTNLLDNALRHTPSGGLVEVRPELDGERVCVMVHDTGVGIAPDQLESIFDRFSRIDSSRPRTDGEGAGLGLAIARKILDLHGGVIKAESTPGEGTTFTFGLPVAG